MAAEDLSGDNTERDRDGDESAGGSDDDDNTEWLIVTRLSN
jgi:hypothetical protein